MNTCPTCGEVGSLEIDDPDDENYYVACWQCGAYVDFFHTIERTKKDPDTHD